MKAQPADTAPELRPLSRLLASLALPLPDGATSIGPVDHPVSGLGGLLVRFASGIFAIQQCGTYRTVNQRWAAAAAAKLEASHA